MTEYQLRFEFKSDWGIGTGFGRTGEIDRIIAKDTLGLPTIPAKTVTGMMRDACEEAAYALDGGDPAGGWHRWLEWLFGSQPANGGAALRPKPAAMSIRQAELCLDIRESVKADNTGRLAQATTIIRPGVEVNDVTGIAEDDTLRMEERARAGLVATAPVEVEDMAADLPAHARALLVCGAALIETVGGKRRRGAGRCDVRLIDSSGACITVDPADLRKVPHAPPKPPSDPLNVQFHPGSATETTHYSFDITCITPVAAVAGVTGNVVESLDYIPGYLLLPIVARAMNAGAAAAIANGSLLVSDATPVVDGVRLLPAPRCVEAAKGVIGAKSLHNALSGRPVHRTVPLKDGWLNPQCALTATEVHKVKLVERAHAVIDDHAQRPTESSGGLFVQQAIAASQTFRFHVVGPAGLELPKHARVGRAKKDDYGLIEITPYESLAPAESHAAQGADGKPGESFPVVTWCVSDVLLRDDQLQSTTSADALARAVAENLGVAITGDAEATAFHAVRRHETWSATWGLPRPSLVAIKAGTVVQFQLVGAPAAAEIAKCENAGIGERTAEGFGRIVINPDLLELADSALTGCDGDPDRDAVANRSDGPSSRGRADCPAAPDQRSQEVRGLWRFAVEAWIDDAALAAGASEGPKGNVLAHLGLDKLSRSQLGLLRERVSTSQNVKIAVIGRLAKPQADGGLNRELCTLLGEPGHVWPYLDDQGEAIKNDAQFSLLARRLFLLHCVRAASRASQRADDAATRPASIPEVNE